MNKAAVKVLLIDIDSLFQIGEGLYSTLSEAHQGEYGKGWNAAIHAYETSIRTALRDYIPPAAPKEGEAQAQGELQRLREALELAERTFRKESNPEAEMAALAKIREALAGRE